MERRIDSSRSPLAYRSSAALALGLAGAVAFGLSGATAQASYPGTNGTVICSGALAPASPDGSRLELFSINPDGTGETRLMENTNSDFSPRYSADGTKVAWVRDNQIWTMNADGTNQVGPLTEGEPNNSFMGDWSPDGKQLVFQSSRDGNFEVYRMNADGSEEVNLTNNATTGANSDSQPTWSPDGTRIAFQSNRDGNANIHVMNADGSNVVNTTASSPAEESAPRWSPDGSQIAFQSDRAVFPRPGVARNLEIYRMKVDGSDVKRLTFNDYDADAGPGTLNLTGFDLNPSWSPDGTRIVFHSGRAEEHRDTGAPGSGIIGQWEAYTVDAVNGESAAGSGLTRLTNRAGNDERCDWQPLAAAQPPSPPQPPPDIGTPPVGPPPGGGPDPVNPCGTPGGAGYLNPAKLRVSRARVSGEDRRLDVLAPITTRARGADVAVTYQGDGRNDTFDAEVTESNTLLDQIRFMEPITRGQAELGTGIVNLHYLGDADTRPELVRLRAASQRAELDVEEISLTGDRLAAAGSVTSRAEGIVRLRYSYVDPDGSEQVHLARATIQDDGDWELEDDQVPAQLARCGGYLSIQFTGYFERRIRGEQLAYELNAGQTRQP